MDSHCGLCGSGDFEVVGEVDRKGAPLKTVMCNRCGLIAHAQIPSDSELAEFYASRYRREYHGEATPSPRRVVREWRRGANLFQMLAEHCEPGGKVLEIGAGIGCNLKHFELAGFDAAGIEPGEGFLKFSQKKLHARIEQGMLADVPQQHDQDLVLLVHVLEHLPSPVAALARIRELLRPRGKLYVEVPNCGAPHAAPGKLFHFAHIHNFTPATLQAAGRLAGFDVVRVFSAPRDRNLMVLFQAGQRLGTLEEEAYRAGYREATAALARYNTLTYHLRFGYVAERLRTVIEHQRQRIGAEKELARILDICQRRAEQAPAEGAPSNAARRQAA